MPSGYVDSHASHCTSSAHHLGNYFTLTVKLKCDRPSFHRLVCDRLLFSVYALFIQCIACSHHSHFIALQCIAYLFVRSQLFVRDRRTGE